VLHILILFFTLSLTARAETYTLFSEQNLIAENYEIFLSKLVPGDIIRFSDGNSFTITEILTKKGFGNNDIILGIGDGKVIRIPKYKRAISSKLLLQAANISTIDFTWSVRETVLGYRELAETGIPHVKVYLHESVNFFEYVILDKVEVEFTLREFLTGNTNGIDLFKRQRLLNKLMEFAQHTSGYSTIGDFGASQIVWNGREWILLDWTSGLRRGSLSDFEVRILNNIEFKEQLGRFRERIRSRLNADLLPPRFRVRAGIKNCLHRIISILP